MASDDDGSRVSDADVARRKANQEKSGPNRLKALEAAQLAHPHDDRTLLDLIRELRSSNRATVQSDVRAVIDRWLARHGQQAISRLPAEVVEQAYPERRLQASASEPVRQVAEGAPPPLRPQTIDEYEILRPLAISASQHLFVATHRRDGVVEPAIARWLPGIDGRTVESWFALHRNLARPLLECRTTRQTLEKHVVGFYDCRPGIPLSAIDLEAEGGPTRRERTRIVAALSSALKRLHASNVHHGDLRPELIIAYREESGDWAVQLLPGWSATEEGTRIAVAERDAWFEGAPQHGEASDLYSLARIARELIGPRAAEASALAVLLRDLEHWARQGKLSSKLALGVDKHPGVFHELVGADDWNDVQRLSGWSYKRLVGIGSLGVVFEAQHPHRHTQAIKFLRTSASVPSLVQAFKDRSLVGIRHDNLVHVEDCTAADQGAPYYEIMECLIGQSLADLLHEAELVSPDDLFSWMRDLCRAATVLQMRGFTHLDLRPPNLFIAVRADGRRRVVVLDYRTGGSLADGAKPVTRAADPRYIAPEILSFHPPRVSGAADVFSAGRILTDLLDHSRLPSHQVDALKKLAAAMTDADATSRPDFSLVYFRLDQIEAAPEPEEAVELPLPTRTRPWKWIGISIACALLALLATVVATGARSDSSEARRLLSEERSVHEETKTEAKSAREAVTALTTEQSKTAGQLNDEKKRADGLETELKQARDNDAETQRCLGLTVDTYRAELGAQCRGRGESIAKAMDQLRTQRLAKLRSESLSGATAQVRHDRAEEIRTHDPRDPGALETLLEGRGSLCRSAKDAAYDVIDGPSPIASLAEAGWEARYDCADAPRTTHSDRDEKQALRKLAEISGSTDRVITLLQRDPIQGVSAGLVRTQDEKTLCEYINEAIQTLPHTSTAEKKNSLRNIQLQRGCKGIAPITLTADRNASLVIFDPSATLPRDEKKHGSFDLPAPANYEIQAHWNWPGAPASDSQRVSLTVGLQEAKQINLRRIEVRSTQPLARVDLTEKHGRSSVSCVNVKTCGLGVLFLGDVAHVSVKVVPADGNYAELSNCTQTPQGCELEIQSRDVADSINVVSVSVKPPPQLSVVATNGGAVTVGPIACAAYPCVLNPGSEYTVDASPVEAFDRWDNCPLAVGARCTIRPLAGNTYRVTARFRPSVVDVSVPDAGP